MVEVGEDIATDSTNGMNRTESSKEGYKGERNRKIT